MVWKAQWGDPAVEIACVLSMRVDAFAGFCAELRS